MCRYCVCVCVYYMCRYCMCACRRRGEARENCWRRRRSWGAIGGSLVGGGGSEGKLLAPPGKPGIGLAFDTVLTLCSCCCTLCHLSAARLLPTGMETLNPEPHQPDAWQPHPGATAAAPAAATAAASTAPAPAPGTAAAPVAAAPVAAKPPAPGATP